MVGPSVESLREFREAQERTVSMKSLKTNLVGIVLVASAMSACGGSGSSEQNLYEKEFSSETTRLAVEAGGDNGLGYWEQVESKYLGSGVNLDRRLKIESERATIAIKCTGADKKSEIVQGTVDLSSDGEYVVQSDFEIQTALVQTSDGNPVFCYQMIPKGMILVSDIKAGRMSSLLEVFQKLGNLEENQ